MTADEAPGPPVTEPPPRRPHVLVLGPERGRSVVLEELTPALGPSIVVSGAQGPDDGLDAIPGGATLAMALVVVAGGARASSGTVDDLIATLADDPRSAHACMVLVTDRPEHDDVHRSLDQDLLQAVVPMPWTPGNLAIHVRSQLARWLRIRDPHDAALPLLVDGPRSSQSPTGPLLRDLELDEAAVTRRLLLGIDGSLGRRPRLVLPPGTRLTQQGADVDGVVVVISGSVALDRATAVGDLRLHHASTGPVIGLLSLAQQRKAFFTARTTTEVRAVHLSLEQLELSLRTAPELSAVLAAVSVRALARRLRRAEQLQVERLQLNRELEAERSRLAEALRELEEARLELVESARFATLGELAAGVAHELNNPVAGLSRAASYVAGDLDRLLEGHPAGPALRAALTAGRSRRPRSTSDDRAIRRAMTEAVGDRHLAEQLVAAGIEEPDEGRRIARDVDEDALALLGTANQLGIAVATLDVASDRIADLVSSLRAYARPSSEPVDGVDVHASIEDALRLVAHQLEGIEVEREYAGVPTIRAYPGQLSQVWTNLLANAADSLRGSGRLRIRTDAPDPEHVRVRITDDGPGIDPDVLPRLFEPRFTTKQGTVRYGLGLGLAITKRIVDAHGGSVTLSSASGETTATVLLPVAGPADDDTSGDVRRTDDRAAP